jgi:hypothetical protein
VLMCDVLVTETVTVTSPATCTAAVSGASRLCRHTQQCHSLPQCTRNARAPQQPLAVAIRVGQEDLLGDRWVRHDHKRLGAKAAWQVAVVVQGQHGSMGKDDVE